MTVEFYKKRVYPFFDKAEDRVRSWLSRRPKLYAILAAVAIILLWRAIWHIADLLENGGGIIGWLFKPEVTLVTSIIGLLATGLFVSFFVGDSIISSGLRKEKKFVDHAEEEMKKEEVEIHHMEKVLDKIEEEVEHLHGEHVPKVLKQTEVRTEQRSGGGVQPKG